MESFRETSDRLKRAGVSLEVQAKALGIEYQTLRSMRADPASKSYRTPPPPSSYLSAWAAVLREGARQLLEEADKLERQAGAAQ